MMAMVLLVSKGVAVATTSNPLPLPQEPYPSLHGGRYVEGHGAVQNPDPLRDYVWDQPTLAPVNSSLQLITVLPAVAVAFPTSAFAGVSTLVNSTTGSARAISSGTIRVDFAMELAGWLRLRSPDLTVAAVAAGCIYMSVGESSVPQFFSPSRLSK